MPTEIAKWLMTNFPTLMAVLVTVGFVGGFIRGFDFGSFHWPGFTDLWRLNGDRKRHEYSVKKSHITYSDKGLATEQRKWRRRVRDVIRDLNHHRIRIDFIGNESISAKYIAMWRDVIKEFSVSCFFDFTVIGGGAGQSKLLEMLLHEQFDLVEKNFEATGKVDLDLPIFVCTSEKRSAAPNKLIYDFIRDREVLA